tara:strand:- start:152 stop:277 length:126 start_codon:yes stop_codon:yes gene_type:complete
MPGLLYDYIYKQSKYKKDFRVSRKIGHAKVIPYRTEVRREM